MRVYFNILLMIFGLILTIQAQTNLPRDWYYGDPNENYVGISMNQAYENFLNKNLGRTVIVAVIDSGIDVEHEDLKDNIWTNPNEIPGNGKDDDNNGYVDDIHGWNFIGGPNGQNVGSDSYEATRVYASLKYKYENADPTKIAKSQKMEYEQYIKAKEIVDKEITKAKNNIARMDEVSMKVKDAIKSLEKALDGKELNSENVTAINADGDQKLSMGKELVLHYLTDESYTNFTQIEKSMQEDIESDKREYQNRLDYAYNINFDPRKSIVMDDYSNPLEKKYGNNDVEGPNALHGTHVAGIIGAVRNNGIGMDGVAQNVKLMSVRAVPDGDERDKDVANAIRYAVDNGASVINMSFGKGFSPNKDVVDAAIKYAESKDVLLIHAAGNSAQNNDEKLNYPNQRFAKKSGFLCKKQKTAKNWIEVGALNYQRGDMYAAPFSNYGAKNVDLFSPGMKIYSTLPNNEYANLQGTSMAAPVVAGVAASIRSLYPALTAEQVKEAIMKSVTPVTEEVIVPGTNGAKALFSKLSVTGGVVNQNAALMYASKMKGKKKVAAERA